jgi:hypothetical protein
MKKYTLFDGDDVRNKLSKNIVSPNPRTLLILFGEYRLFDAIVHQYKNLDKVDIIFSTWNKSTYPIINNITEYRIKKLIPHCNPIITNVDSPIFNKTNNIGKMHYHWITAVNSITDSKKYDKIIVHRCDLISEWSKLLDIQFEPNTLYLDNDHRDITQDSTWVNDVLFAGDFRVIKKFVNLFPIYNRSEESHTYIGEAILKNNIKWEELRTTIGDWANTYVVRWPNQKIIEDLNKQNRFLIEMDKSSDIMKQFEKNNDKHLDWVL